MNETFRQYVFGRSFNISLSEKQIETLAALCKGDEIAQTIASFGFAGSQMHGLHRRGFVEHFSDGTHSRWRPTKAGLLVYDLLVEAGEYAALEVKRAETLRMETELHHREWEERFGDVKVKLRDRFRKDGAEVQQ